MTHQSKYGFVLVLCAGSLAAIGCSSASTPSVPFNGSSGGGSGDSSSGSGVSSGTSSGSDTSGASSGDPSSGSTSGSGSVGSSGASSGTATSGSTGGPSSGAAGSGSGTGTPDSGTGAPTDSGTMGEGGPAAGGTSFTGTLGTLGTAKPTVSSFVIQNSGETLIYLTSAPITCAMMQTSRWLGSAMAGSQVIEVVVPSTKMTGTVAVASFGGAEVNYAPGGMSSSYETVAASGSVTFKSCVAGGVCEGTAMATYPSPAGAMITGSFHAEFCMGGQQY